MEIAPNVHWINGGASNMYLCIEEDGLTLIDCGMPRREKMVITAIADLGYRPHDLKTILITHPDIDHVGSLAAIQSATGATVWASAETAAFLPTGRSPKHLPALFQFILNQFLRYKPISLEHVQTFAEGDSLPILDGLTILETPGHTLDHHSFYSRPHGILFAGDALNTRNGRLQVQPKTINADQQAAINSAIRLLELAPAIIACGHGVPLSDHSMADLMGAFNTLRQGQT